MRGTMKVIAFIEAYQQDVLEKILRHCGLWQERAPRAPPRPWLISERRPVPAHIDPDGDFLEHQRWDRWRSPSEADWAGRLTQAGFPRHPPGQGIH